MKSLNVVLLLLLFVCLNYLPDQAISARDPDSGKTIRQLVESKGFQFEEYPIKVGMYLLLLHRVLKPSTCAKSDPRKVVMFGEPLGGASIGWVLDMANNSWAFYLANNCFDVWLGNCRGTGYGDRYINGTKASPQDKAFFDFTLVDIGAQDWPPQIDFVLNKTGQQQLFWFGYSQGAISAFAMLAKRPEYNKKLRAFASLGASQSLCNMAALRPLRKLQQTGHRLRHSMGGHSGRPDIFHPICMRFPGLCFVFTLPLGSKYESNVYFNKSRMQIYAEHLPHGTSIKNMLYYGQLGSYCDGRVFDYDEDRYLNKTLLNSNPEKYSINLRKYGTLTPPRLDLSTMTVPVKFYYSDGDGLITPKDVEQLAKSLPNCAGLWRMKDKRWGHLTFMFPAFYPAIFQNVRDFYTSYL